MEYRPEFVEDKHLEYLDELRKSGKTNMYIATPYLRDKFPELYIHQANKILAYWMATFSERHLV